MWLSHDHTIRGMFTLALSQPLPTAPLAIPPLNLSGRVPPRNASVGLDHIEKPPEMTVWAEFHNGAAAGLKISPFLSQVSCEVKCDVWYIFNFTEKREKGGGWKERWWWRGDVEMEVCKGCSQSNQIKQWLQLIPSWPLISARSSILSLLVYNLIL